MSENREWKRMYDLNGGFLSGIETCSGEVIAYMDLNRPDAEVAADARLLAASPVLLAATHLAIYLLEEDCHLHISRVLDLLRSAVSKATQE